MRVDEGQEVVMRADHSLTLRRAAAEARAQTPWLFTFSSRFKCSIGDETWLLSNTRYRNWRRGEVVAVSSERVIIRFHDQPTMDRDLDVNRRSRRLWRGHPTAVENWDNDRSTTFEWVLQRNMWKWQMTTEDPHSHLLALYSHGEAGAPMQGPLPPVVAHHAPSPTTSTTRVPQTLLCKRRTAPATATAAAPALVANTDGTHVQERGHDIQGDVHPGTDVRRVRQKRSGDRKRRENMSDLLAIFNPNAPSAAAAQLELPPAMPNVLPHPPAAPAGVPPGGGQGQGHGGSGALAGSGALGRGSGGGGGMAVHHTQTTMKDSGQEQQHYPVALASRPLSARMRLGATIIMELAQHVSTRQDTLEVSASIPAKKHPSNTESAPYAEGSGG